MAEGLKSSLPPGYRIKRHKTEAMFFVTNSIKTLSARFGSTYTKIGTIQRRLPWPLRKDDMQIREAFHVFKLEPIIQSEVSKKDKDHYNILTHIYGI